MSEYEYNLVCPGEPFPNLNDAPFLCVDVETKPRNEHRETEDAALHPWRGQVFGFAIGVPGTVWYLPLSHTSPDAPNVSDIKAFQWLNDTLAARLGRTLVNHNIKFDLKFLAQHGVYAPRATDLRCTMTMARLVDEREETHGLKPLAARWLGMDNVEERAKNAYLKGQKKSFQDWSVIPVDIMAPYACGDVERAIKLHDHCEREIKAQDLDLVWTLERKVTRALLESEMTGFKVDIDLLKLRKAQWLRAAIEIEADIERLCGVSINPASPEELADLVSNRMGLPILRRTKPSQRYSYGQPKFDDETLLQYIRQFPAHARLFWQIRKARRLHHLITSFVDSYLFWHVNGIIHADFNQTVNTGRMSCTNPNLQQVQSSDTWEIDTGDFKETWAAPGAREFFVAREGCELQFYDYSQIEYRFFAHYAKSERMISAYRDNPDMDFHQWCTDFIFGGRLPRRPVKNLNFGMIYRMGKGKLIKSMSSMDAPITDAEGESILETYHNEVPELKPLWKSTERVVWQRKYISTILGRRRRASYNLRAKRGEKEDKGLLPYQALNAICQGSGADVLKDRFVAAEEWCSQRSPDEVYPIVTVHDEVIIEADKGYSMEAARALKPILEKFEIVPLRVPMAVNLKIGDRWSEAREIKIDGLPT